MKPKVSLVEADMMLRGLRRDVGYFEEPQEEEMALKVQGIAKFLTVEKRVREKRQREELERSQNMISTLLQYSIMMNSGMSSFGGMNPSQPMPSF